LGQTEWLTDYGLRAYAQKMSDSVRPLRPMTRQQDGGKMNAARKFDESWRRVRNTLQQMCNFHFAHF
jgi:hypothetical protein